MEQSLGLLNVMAVEEGEEPALYRSELDHTREGKCRGETGPRYTACAAHQAATYQKVVGLSCQRLPSTEQVNPTFVAFEQLSLYLTFEYLPE